MTEATIARADILITVRGEARKILEQLGPAGVKSLTAIQKEVDELQGKYAAQQKTIKDLQKAMEQQGVAATKAGDAAKTAGTQASAAGAQAVGGAVAATFATNAWAFAVRTLERVWKGLKSALIIAPLLAIAQKLLSVIIDTAASFLGFGDNAADAAAKVDILTDSEKRLNAALLDTVLASERARLAREFVTNGGDATVGSAVEAEALKARIKTLQALQAQIIGGELTNKQTLAALTFNVQRNPYVAADKVFGDQLAKDAFGAVSNQDVSGITAAGAVALLNDELVRVTARLQTAEAAATGFRQALAGSFTPKAGGPSDAVLGEAAFADEQLSPGLTRFSSSFGKDAGLIGAEPIDAGDVPAALAGLDATTLQTVQVAQGGVTLSAGALTKALDDQRKAMAVLNHEASLLAITLSAQSKEEQRSAAAATQKLDLMAQAATTEAERIEVINLQIAAERHLLDEQLAAGQLVRQEYDAQIALLEKIRGKKINAAKDDPLDKLTNPDAGFGVSALATAFSDIATNANTATGAAQQFFAALLKGIADVAAQSAAKGIFGALLSALAGAAASGGGTTSGGTTPGSTDASGGGSSVNDGPQQAAMGGVFPGGFRPLANGGIATRPTLGLIAEAGMSEAFVPLPDGKTIPVTMTGGGGVTINVTSVVQAIDRADFDAHLDRHGKRIAEIVAGKMATHRGLRNSTRDTVRGGR